MKIPRDLTGPDLAKALRAFGYERVRQDGSHIRLTTQRGGQHHISASSSKNRPLGFASVKSLPAEGPAQAGA